MKNSKTQKELTNAWSKMELNSSYGLPQVASITHIVIMKRKIEIKKR